MIGNNQAQRDKGALAAKGDGERLCERPNVGVRAGAEFGLDRIPTLRHGNAALASERSAQSREQLNLLGRSIDRAELLRNQIARFGAANQRHAAGREVQDSGQAGLQGRGQAFPWVLCDKRFHREPDHQRQVVIGGVFTVRQKTFDQSRSQVFVAGALGGRGNRQTNPG